MDSNDHVGKGSSHNVNRNGNGNLRSWKPGQSGNPRGGKRDTPKSFTALCREELAKPCGDGDPRTRLQRLMQALEQQALAGSSRSANLILERLDPAPRQNITINNNVPAPVLDALRRVGIEELETPRPYG